jgi:hypothetical protein
MSKLATPRIRTRPHYGLNRSTTAAANPGLQGSAMPGSTGGVVANGTTYREVVATLAATTFACGLLTVGATGTLNIKPIRPHGAQRDRRVSRRRRWQCRSDEGEPTRPAPALSPSSPPPK